MLNYRTRVARVVDWFDKVLDYKGKSKQSSFFLSAVSNKALASWFLQTSHTVCESAL